MVKEESPRTISLDKCSSPDKSFLSKQVYVEDKIKRQINSENRFNSPKFINSPSIKTPTNVTFGIKEFFNNSSDKQKIK